jgi:transcriptional regulator with XRE-family HTH domain
MQDFDPRILKKMRLSYPGKLTQADMAKVIGNTRGTYGKKEKGLMAVSIEDLTRLAKFYDVEISDFFTSSTKYKTVSSQEPSSMVKETPLELERALKKDDAPPTAASHMSDLNELIIDLNHMLVDLHRQIAEKDRQLAEKEREIQKLKSMPPSADDSHVPPKKSKK